MGCCQDGFSGGGGGGGGDISGTLTPDFFPIAIAPHTIADDVLFKRDLGTDIELIWGDGASGVGPAVGYQINIEGIPGHLRSFGLRTYENDRVSMSLGGDDNFSIRAYDGTGVEIDRPIFIHLDFGGTIELRRDVQLNGGNLYYDFKPLLIRATTPDGADDSFIYIAGGGEADADRGAWLSLMGNEVAAAPGLVNLVVGDVDGARMELQIREDEPLAFQLTRHAGDLNFIGIDTTIGAEVLTLGLIGSGLEATYDYVTGNWSALALVAGSGANQIVLNGNDGNSSFAGYAWVHGMLIVGSASQLHEEALAVVANVVAIDAQLSDLYVVDFSTATGTVTFATPTNLGVGRRFMVRVTQGGTPRAWAFSAAYSFPSGTPPVASGAGAHDYWGCIYNSVTNKWDVLPPALNYT